MFHAVFYTTFPKLLSAVALALGVSQSTVEYHLRNVYKKLQVSSRTEAVLRLGKSIGDNLTSELGKSTVEMDDKPADNAGKSISQQRLPMKKMFYIISAGMLGTVLIVMLIFANKQVNTKAITQSIDTTAPTSIATYPLAKNTEQAPIPTISAIPSNPETSSEKFLIIKQNDYYLSTLDSLNSTLLFSSKDGHIEMASLSPDQTQFAYFKDNYVYVQNIAEQKTVTVNKEIIGSVGGNIRWSPDAKNFSCLVPMPSSPAWLFARLIFQAGRSRRSSTKRIPMNSVISHWTLSLNSMI